VRLDNPAMPDTPSTADREALAWLQRRQSGRWTPADEAGLSTWLAAAPEHPVAWLAAQQLWHDLDGVRALAQSDLQRARAAASTTRGRQQVPTRLRSLAWPAGALALLLAGVATWRALPGAFEPEQLVQTAVGQIRRIDLADGSRIEVDSASRLRIRTGLACRCIELIDGDAVFTVAHGDPRPFRVRLGPSQVVDVGTEFWVQRHNAGAEVAVNEGEVDVFPRAGAPAARLRAGQTLALDAHGQPRTDSVASAMPPPSVDRQAWRSGHLLFRDASLTEVLDTYSRYHPLRFELDARLQGYRLSGRFAIADLDGLYAVLQAGYPAQVQRGAGGVVRVGFKAS
jgi:transmembrane sensor